MLEKEYQFYKDNLPQLLKEYAGKYIVIKDQKVVGVYDSDQLAYEESVKKYELGTFLIKLCMPEKDEIIQTFHSRVVFAQ
jgi:hypothetical protein